MKSSFMRKLAALVMAVMMLVPMAAQAEGTPSGYYEASVNDLVVDYMGTQLDFTGLGLKLFGGMDADNKNAIGGLTVTLPENNKVVLAGELGEKEATLLIANELMKLPYDRFGEILAKISSDADMEQFGDISPMMDSFWAGVAEVLVAATSDGEESVDPANDIAIDTAAIEALLDEVVASATPVDAERTIGDATYKGSEVSIDMTAGQMNELIAEMVTAVYGNDQVVSGVGAVSDAINSAAEQSGADMGDVDIAAIYNSFVENVQKINLPNGLKMNVFVATTDDGTNVIDIKVERCTLDMEDYIISMSEDVSDANVTINSDDVMSMDVEFAFSKVAKDDSKFVDLSSSMYLTGSDTSYVDVYLTSNAAKPEGYLSLSVNTNPSALGEEGDAGSMSISAEWSEDDSHKTMNGSLAVFTGDAQQGAFDFSYDKTMMTADDDLINIALNVTDQNGDTMPVVAIGYNLHRQNDADNSTKEATFSASIANAITVSGRVEFSKQPMGEDKLMSTASASALNLADASDEEMQTLVNSIQAELTDAMMSAIQVPGVATLLTSAMSGTTASEPVTAG